MSSAEAELQELGWRSTWGSRVDSESAISSRSDFWFLELAPLDDLNRTCVNLVAWPDPTEIHAELFGLDGSHVELSKLQEILTIGERIFKARYEDRK